MILGIDFLKWYNPSISWIDWCVGIPYLAANGGVCKSSGNYVAKAAVCSDRGGMSKCSNGMLFKNQVVVIAKQVAESIKVNGVLTKAFVNLVRGDPESMMWCTLVRPVVSQAAGQDGV